MNNITIIPDLHADPMRLDLCLEEAGSHDIAFLGDLIDAGHAVRSSNDLYVLQKVKTLIDNNRAVAVMGNHELNAILFHRRDRHGAALRAHSATNYDQHRSFLDQFGLGTPLAIYWTEWFLTLPLWIEQNGCRIVHACWDDEAINTIKERRPDGLLLAADLEEVAAKETTFAKAVETLTSGVEVQLPDGHQFHDGKGVRRDHVRIAWWLANKGTWREVALSVPNVEELPNTLVSGNESISLYSEYDPPVFVGHYKMRGKPSVDIGQVGCLDYPDLLCVYHWNGEATLNPANLRSRVINENAKELWR
jgi:hypothetical protein